MMWQTLLCVLPIAISTLAIRVPVDGKDENITEPVTAEKKQDTFYITDSRDVDSYLIPPDPHISVPILHDVEATPATYLLPPSPEKHIDYYATPDTGEQTDWYPIAQQNPQQGPPIDILLPPNEHKIIPIILNNQTFDIIENPRGGKAYEGEPNDYIHLPVLELEPPRVDAYNDYYVHKLSSGLELPEAQIHQPFRTNPESRITSKKQYIKNAKKPHKLVETPLPLHLLPPKPDVVRYKKPTKLYPKKVASGYKPIPIPLSNFAGNSDIPHAKPLKPFRPVANDDIIPFIPDDNDDENIFSLKKAQKERNKGKSELQLQQPLAADEDTYGVNAPAEPETSATIYRHPGIPGRNTYPAPLRQAPPRPPAVPQKNGPPPPPPGERTEFRMHGMKGPHSYQFGFDTGKGKNRQFRFEERDNDGRVKGHYGYMDKHGKLRVVNYGADPETGFHAESPSETPTGDGSSSEP